MEINGGLDTEKEVARDIESREREKEIETEITEIKI